MLLLFSLSACSERNLEIGFLSKVIQGKTEFNVDNAIDDGDMLPDGGGGANEGKYSGVFAAKRTLDPAGILSSGGFRCVYHP